jgi:predicted aspartyl protease
MRIVLPILVWCCLSGAAACEFVKISSVKIVADATRIYIPGSINGQDVRFMVDTGAEFSMLSPAAAASLGLGVAATRETMHGATGDAIDVGLAHVDTLTLGEWSGHGIRLRVAGTAKESGRSPPTAILGEDFLRHFDVEIDVKGGVITLFQPKDCENSNLAYWSDSYNVAEMLGHDRGSHHVLVAAKVDDHEVRALLDSGAPFSSVTETTALAIGIGPDSPGVKAIGQIRGIGGAPVDAWLATFPSFTLDQETIKPAKLLFHRVARIMPGVGSHIDQAILRIQMILGLDFIRAHRVLISNSQQKVYFTYAGGAAFQSVGSRAEQAASP